MEITKIESPIGSTVRWVVSAQFDEIDVASSSETRFRLFLHDLMRRISDAAFEEVYPKIREQILAKYVTPELVAEEVGKAIRAKLAEQLFPVKASPVGK